MKPTGACCEAESAPRTLISLNAISTKGAGLVEVSHPLGFECVMKDRISDRHDDRIDVDARSRRAFEREGCALRVCLINAIDSCRVGTKDSRRSPPIFQCAAYARRRAAKQTVGSLL